MAARVARLLTCALVLATGCVVSTGPSRTRTTPAPGARPRVELTFEGIENMRFGASVDVVVDAMRVKLGRPDEDSGWIDAFSPFGTCPGSQVRGVRWKRMRLLFSDGPTDAAEQGVRHFFAYDVIADLDPRPLDARTSEGIGLGSTLADVRAAYGAAAVEVDDSPETGPGGRVNGPGKAWLGLGLTAASDTGRVRSIAAGAPSCGE